MRVEIDPKAGVCTGVKRAIRLAEAELLKGEEVFSLGELIHNRLEVERLSKLGLRAIEYIKNGKLLREYRGKKLLVRTHGVSKGFVEELRCYQIRLIDATCPIVRRSQKLVEEYSRQGYQIVIVGKKEHPEVIGLLGHCENKALVALGKKDLENVDHDQKTLLLAQTTVCPDIFYSIHQHLKTFVPQLDMIDTTCKQIKLRRESLVDFARRHDVVIFVGGKNSSNAKFLFRLCHHVNAQTHWIESSEEVDWQWLEGTQSVGISGSASTPRWQLETIKNWICKTERRII